MKVMGVVLAVGALALVGCTGEPVASDGSPSSSASASRSASSSATTTTTTPSSSAVVVPTTVAAPSTVTQTVVETVVVDNTPVLTHTGFGPIKLAMSHDELMATGLIGESRDSTQTCRLYYRKDGNGAVWIQQGKGVMAISVKFGAVTAEGLPVDIDARDPRVAQAYPDGELGPNGYSARLNADVFYFFSNGTTLVRRGQECFN